MLQSAVRNELPTSGLEPEREERRGYPRDHSTPTRWAIAKILTHLGLPMVSGAGDVHATRSTFYGKIKKSGAGDFNNKGNNVI